MEAAVEALIQFPEENKYMEELKYQAEAWANSSETWGLFKEVCKHKVIGRKTVKKKENAVP